MLYNDVYRGYLIELKCKERKVLYRFRKYFLGCNVIIRSDVGSLCWCEFEIVDKEGDVLKL